MNKPPTHSTQQLRDLDRQHIWHPFTHMKQWLADEPLVITSAEGMYLIDSDGRRYLDGVSSLWCNVHGHRVPHINQAIAQQLQRVAHTTLLGLTSEPAILLADRLMRLVPRNLKKIFYSDAGATAIEIAFKLAAQYWYNVGKPAKCEFVGFTQAYHGDTLGAISVGRTETFHRAYFPLLFKTHFAPTPHVYRSQTPGDPAAVMGACVNELQKILSENAQRIAAICIEPIVQGAAGIIVHPCGFLREVRRLADAHDVLLICDEVAVGFGRTGLMFASEHEQVNPDLMCVAKGISGGYLPLAATFATQKIFDAFLGEAGEGRTFFHGHTYTGNPLACAGAIASLELFKENDLLTDVRRKSSALATMLEPLMSHVHVGDIRQAGLMVGIELVQDRQTRQPFDPRQRVGAAVCRRLRDRGIILRPLLDTVVLMPPLAMPLENMREIVDALQTELAEL